ncbi:MAG: FMN-binding protein [Salinivirgaceae bacterium]
MKVYPIFIGFVLLMMQNLVAQDSIDHYNRVLLKTLEKGWNVEEQHMQQVQLKPAIYQKYEVNGALFAIRGSAIEPLYIYSGRVTSCRSGGCNTVKASPDKPAGEYFDYFIIFDGLGEIQAVRVFNYKATKGHAIASKGWLRQFEKLGTKEKPAVNKNIDGISGATISTHAITSDIAIRMTMIREVLD